MSRRTRSRQHKMPREKHTAKQKCERKKKQTKAEALAVVRWHRRMGAAAGLWSAYRCDRCSAFHVGHRRGSSWSR